MALIPDSTQGINLVRPVTAELNERGILTARGGAWHPTSAARLLSHCKPDETAVTTRTQRDTNGSPIAARLAETRPAPEFQKTPSKPVGC
jgi:hypothetical protein